jgi:hypothetical protein
VIKVKEKIIQKVKNQADEKIYLLNFTVGDLFQRNYQLFKHFRSTRTKMKIHKPFNPSSTR